MLHGHGLNSRKTASTSSQSAAATPDIVTVEDIIKIKHIFKLMQHAIKTKLWAMMNLDWHMHDPLSCVNVNK
jgi:hypothetical protein